MPACLERPPVRNASAGRLRAGVRGPATVRLGEAPVADRDSDSREQSGLWCELAVRKVLDALQRPSLVPRLPGPRRPRRTTLQAMGTAGAAFRVNAGGRRLAYRDRRGVTGKPSPDFCPGRVWASSCATPCWQERRSPDQADGVWTASALKGRRRSPDDWGAGSTVSVFYKRGCPE